MKFYKFTFLYVSSYFFILLVLSSLLLPLEPSHTVMKVLEESGVQKFIKEKYVFFRSVACLYKIMHSTVFSFCPFRAICFCIFLS